MCMPADPVRGERQAPSIQPMAGLLHLKYSYDFCDETMLSFLGPTL